MIEWFRHDIHCLQDDRLFALVSRYGAEGYAVFFHTIETMYANNGDPISEITLRRIAFELSMPFDKVVDIIEFASSDSCGHLFESGPNGVCSDRVLREVEYQESQRQRYSNMGKASAERRSQGKSNVGSTQVEHKSNVGSTDNITRHNKDNNVSRDYQEEHLSINKKYKTNQTDIVCSEPSNELKLEAENPVEEPIITIISRTGEEVPVYSEMVEVWKEAYPAVDVEAELKKIKSWSISNKTNRKSVNGMDKFINNWLSREQDRAGRPNNKTERNDFYGGKYIKGTNIQMDLVAKGADRSMYTNQPALEDLL